MPPEICITCRFLGAKLNFDFSLVIGALSCPWGFVLSLGLSLVIWALAPLLLNTFPILIHFN